jgi:hypothetical protein
MQITGTEARATGAMQAQPSIFSILLPDFWSGAASNRGYLLEQVPRFETEND